MDQLLQHLQRVGVHNLKNDRVIMLEILENKLHLASEIDVLINELLDKLHSSCLKKIMLECPKMLLDSLNRTRSKMEIIGERVVYKRSLMTSLNVSIPDYEVWSISDNNSVSFLSEVMGISFIDAEKFLTGMSIELPSQVKEMFTVYKVNKEPVGVVFPHIEPNTDKEGRIFWIGMHPNFLGSGFGRNLHAIGLYRLKNEFKAISYLGMTQVDNIPMRNIMVLNGCIQNENTVISLQYSV
ncbi:GNAT family N-acetyltransferase [Lysinibacillus agricola]|uniref:GNAT family N-acetyltransferase n=1 Tax=Lysinibacillus agricola TaxID=2590012 RepID=A0ABX7AX28_9BACI|nr:MULTISPECIES: GNAT family N-acetyltransferase [Lysinibacillus]KOS60224.1 GNAT family acetyltransferase [Lysinibacillus sp. FJAT-14222]QQP14513.1 GNAT family N-acetyltransferase [Lysinibacillus agricola]